MSHTPGSDAWLGQVHEDVIDPQRPIIDPHIHLWRKRFGRDYLLAELAGDTSSGHNVQGVLFVECHAFYDKQAPEELRSLGETRVITELAQQSQRNNVDAPLKGLIANIDLRLGRDPAVLRDTIERHHAVAGHLLKGIRDPAARDPRPEDLLIPGPGPGHLYGREDFRAGLRTLGQMGLTYDAWHYHHQNADFLELVAAVPDTVFVLDHFGTPLGVGIYHGARDAIFQQWRVHMKELARHPNVYVKLGGLAMPDNGFSWHTGAKPPTSDELMGRQRPYYLHMIDCFGPQRCMFESNFPVDRLSVSYRVLWNAFKKMVADFSETEQNMLFHDTAAKVYRLDVDQDTNKHN